MVVIRSTTRVVVKTDIGEGFYDPIGVGNPGSFVADVGEAGPIAGLPSEGWQGKVVDGEAAYIGKRVALTRKIASGERGGWLPRRPGMGLGVVAHIYDTADRVGGQEIFSGICFAKPIENSK